MVSHNIFRVQEGTFDRTFEEVVLKSSLPVLVQFKAVWSATCRGGASDLSKIAEDYSDRLRVATIDVDENSDLCARYGIREIPTYMVFKGGQKNGSIAGYARPDELIQLVGL